MLKLNSLIKVAIKAYMEVFRYLEIQPVIHFEFEGGYRAKLSNGHVDCNGLNYHAINIRLAQLNILAELKPEYWQNQWEYVSKFLGQSPLKEADDLARAIKIIPHLFSQQGIESTLIKPVLWSGDSRRLVQGTQTIFSHLQQIVHIPNAVQMNISAKNTQGDNLVPINHFGEILQQKLLQTSLPCSLLFLPEEDAYRRIRLKEDFSLTAELSSPDNISGGHQGSVALYKQRGKHNQNMGETALLIDTQGKVLLKEYHWKILSRVEHRIGASSVRYNPYVNMLYALANLYDAICVYTNKNGKFDRHFVPPYEGFSAKALPLSLWDSLGHRGAVSLFEQDRWFSQNINQVVALAHKLTQKELFYPRYDLGELIKTHYLSNFNYNATWL